ncbi:hypothetical protein MHU86_20310 [Fragilaria crotonensis]|nr:hypothetical protein MHU86_20310 [Fragilaria crotonensis]
MVSLIGTNHVDGRFAAFDQMNHCIPTNSNVSVSSGDEVSGVRRIIQRNGKDFVRQPCKARGVSVKDGQDPHVAKFAYIDIPVGAVHGTVLSCCHPLCKSSGRLFRYCIQCQTAVAKRNFNVRHAHGKTHLQPLLMKNMEDVKPESRSTCSSLRNTRAINPISADDAEANIPSFISIDDKVKPNTPVHEPDGAMFPVYVTSGELEVIALLRSRPGHDFAGTKEQWRHEILSYAEKVCQSVHSPTIPLSGKARVYGGEVYDYAPQEFNVCTSADDLDMNNDESASASDFDGVDIASFFEA